MGNKYDPFHAINAFTQNPLFSVDTFSDKLRAITKGSQNFYSNLNTAMNSLNIILKPYIVDALNSVSKYTIIYRDIISEQNKYRQSVNNMWNNLEEELRLKNRYFPKNELINILDNLTKEAKYYLKKGAILYRARKISEQDFPEEVHKLINYIMEKNNTQSNSNKLIQINDIIKNINDIPSDEWEDNYINMNNLQNNLFWGYGKKESDAPSSKDISIPHGRANPSGISYLYTARDTATAISEVQPTIEQFISIAKITTLKRLNLFYFNFPGAYQNSKLLEKHIGEIKRQYELSHFWELEIFFDSLSELFTKPILGNTDYYFTTQYISEFLKNKGFDGIQYKSSLKKRGLNIVLFDTSKDTNSNPINYQIINSSLYKIENVKIISSKILPK